MSFGWDACLVQSVTTACQTLVMLVMRVASISTIITSNHLPNAFCLRSELQCSDRNRYAITDCRGPTRFLGIEAAFNQTTDLQTTRQKFTWFRRFTLRYGYAKRFTDVMR